MNPALEIERLISEHGGRLTRTKKHKVYRFPGGQTFTMSSTPGSETSIANHLSDLRRTLGLTKITATVGERRERVSKPGRAGVPKVEASKLDSPLKDQLRGIGLLEDSLRSQLAQANQGYETMAELHKGAMDAWAKDLAICGNCWWCRVKRWWKGRKA